MKVFSGSYGAGLVETFLQSGNSPTPSVQENTSIQTGFLDTANKISSLGLITGIAVFAIGAWTLVKVSQPKRLKL